jgi:tetratricopeptide (TPR) repeat protein
VQTIDGLLQEAYDLVGQRLPKETFRDAEHPNNRLLIGVTCLRVGAVNVAYRLFESIAQEGPKENANHHFAYVRSLVEMAEIDAENERYSQAAEHMATALAEYPESMGYMMSRVHLEVYLTYYQYQAGRKDEALSGIAALCAREEQAFREMELRDAKALVGPGLCYALHQWALFYAMEGEWDRAYEKAKSMIPYATSVDEAGVEQAERLHREGNGEAAMNRLIEAVRYRDGE